MKLLLNVFGAAALVAAANFAFAADQPAGTGPRTACKADVASLCSGVQPGGGRIAACLKQNEAQVSPACKDALAHARDHKAQSKPSAPQ